MAYRKEEPSFAKTPTQFDRELFIRLVLEELQTVKGDGRRDLNHYPF
jgi:hypothetical protein